MSKKPWLVSHDPLRVRLIALIAALRADAKAHPGDAPGFAATKRADADAIEAALRAVRENWPPLPRACPACPVEARVAAVERDARQRAAECRRLLLRPQAALHDAVADRLAAIRGAIRGAPRP